MKTWLLGTGTPAANPRRFQSAVLVNVAEDYLLFDAGRGAVHQMARVGIDISRVNPVFITHHHFDHINDLFDVIISTAMSGRSDTLKVFGPRGTKAIVTALLEQVYAQDIRFRIEEMNEIRKLGIAFAERPEAIAKVDAQDVEAGITYETDRWRVSADYVLHGKFADAPDFDWRCLGYRVEAEGKVLTISGDTVPDDGIIRLAQNADLLIQCCHFAQANLKDPVAQYLTQHIVPSSGQVGKIAAQAGVKRMALTHLSQSITENDYPGMLEDVRKDFSGDVIIGEDLMELEV